MFAKAPLKSLNDILDHELANVDYRRREIESQATPPTFGCLLCVRATDTSFLHRLPVAAVCIGYASVACEECILVARRCAHRSGATPTRQYSMQRKPGMQHPAGGRAWTSARTSLTLRAPLRKHTW